MDLVGNLSTPNFFSPETCRIGRCCWIRTLYLSSCQAYGVDGVVRLELGTMGFEWPEAIWTDHGTPSAHEKCRFYTPKIRVYNHQKWRFWVPMVGCGFKCRIFYSSPELRKKPLTFTFIWRLIWGACAKGKCWFAKARESKSAPRKPRKLTCVDMCRDLLLQICERFAKDVRKVRESWGVQVQEFPLFAWSGLIGKCKGFLWKC